MNNTTQKQGESEMKHENYFNITENAKEYNDNQWGDETVLRYGIPIEDTLMIMNMYEAMAFLANNDPCSMVAMRIPKDVANKLDKESDEDNEDFRLDLKDEWFIDYKGECI